MFPQPVPITDEPTDRRAGPLTEDDAVALWLARWLGVPRNQLIARYACDPRRLYEIWEGRRFPAAREKAIETFKRRFPTMTGQVDFSYHRRIPRHADPERQLEFFKSAS